MQAHRSASIGILMALLATSSIRAKSKEGPISIEPNPAGGAIAHHALRASIDPATARLDVVDTLTIVHLPETPTSVDFPFLLAKDLDIESIEGIGHEVDFREDRIRPREFWQNPPYDELDGYDRARSVSIVSRGRSPHWPGTLDVVVAYSGTVYDSLRPPKAAYARGFETTAGLIDPRGAYMSYGTFWVPQRPDERFTFRCGLVTPADWHGVSQGKMVTTLIDRDRRINIWDCTHPMEEIYYIAGPFTLRQRVHDDVDVMTFTYENTAESVCERYIAGTSRYLDLYGGLIGAYPFAKFALVENFWQTGFGMPSFTLLGDRVIRLPFILDTSYGHEILHNWWGNGVFVDYPSGNWCEGLTAYGADYLYKEQKSPSDARDYRRTALQGYLDYVSEAEDMPLRRFRQREDFATQAIGYGKSMMVYHQIRRLLGEEGFWEALRDFYSEHQFERASWDDLFDVFSRKAGRNLDGWKNQWLERTGAPSLELRDYRINKMDGDGYRVDVVVEQTQEPLYELVVPVYVGWSGEQVSQPVLLSEGSGMTSFAIPDQPDWIAVDPEYDVLRRIDPAEIPPAISRTLGADTAIVIIAAGLRSNLEAAYRTVAAEWESGARLAIVSESDLAGTSLPDLPIWFFGFGELAGTKLKELDQVKCVPGGAQDTGWSVAGQDYQPGHGVVIAGGPPDRPENAWTLVAGSDAEQVASLGRKIPHYGKYGYLVFEGGANIAKGSWEITTSPLRVDLTEHAK